MIKPINKKFILVLIILGLMYYLLKYPIDEINKTNSKVNTMDEKKKKNTKYLSSLNSQIKEFESKKF